MKRTHTQTCRHKKFLNDDTLTNGPVRESNGAPPLSLALHPRPVVYLPFRIRRHSSSLHAVVCPLPFVAKAVAPNENTVCAVTLPVPPGALVNAPIRPSEHAVAVLHVVAEFAVVDGPVREGVYAVAIPEVLTEAPHVLSVLPRDLPLGVVMVRAVAVHLALLPRPLVDHALAIGGHERGSAVLLVLSPVALVERVVVVEAHPPTIANAVVHLSLVDDVVDPDEVGSSARCIVIGISQGGGGGGGGLDSAAAPPCRGPAEGLTLRLRLPLDPLIVKVVRGTPSRKEGIAPGGKGGHNNARSLRLRGRTLMRVPGVRGGGLPLGLRFLLLAFFSAAAPAASSSPLRRGRPGRRHRAGGERRGLARVRGGWDEAAVLGRRHRRPATLRRGPRDGRGGLEDAPPAARRRNRRPRRAALSGEPRALLDDAGDVEAARDAGTTSRAPPAPHRRAVDDGDGGRIRRGYGDRGRIQFSLLPRALPLPSGGAPPPPRLVIVSGYRQVQPVHEPATTIGIIPPPYAAAVPARRLGNFGGGGNGDVHALTSKRPGRRV
mmetsp:Transcript_18995/g.45604  ORF Transcript_18995/g.45604 Transcript_18995/m.45604 type:complete len:548 (-) Transcript_18995:223-1866(-)